MACDLAVIGGGFTGLWAALLAKEANPGRSVVVVEGNRVGWAASGRNGGFCDASLTHGAANGRERFPSEYAALQRLGAENLTAIETAIGRLGIDCGFEQTGTIEVATEDYQVTELREAAETDGATFLDAGAVRAEVNSPTYLAGGWNKEGTALVDPARLAWGLAAACERIGVRIAEHTPATGLASDADGVTVKTRDGVLRARRVALGTNAFPSLVRRLTPVYRAGLRLRACDRTAQPGPARRSRLGEPAGRRRSGQPVPLLPAHRGQPDPVGRVRRHLPLRPPRTDDLRSAACHLRQARGPLFHHVPAAGRDRVQPPLGRRDRHQQPVLRALRYRAPRPRRLRSRVHRARRGREQVRRPGHARPADRRADRADRAAAWSAASRSPSRPSPSPTWGSRPLAGRSPRPTRNPATGTCGCGPWTRPAWATTPSVMAGVFASVAATPEERRATRPGGARHLPGLAALGPGDIGPDYGSRDANFEVAAAHAAIRMPAPPTGSAP